MHKHMSSNKASTPKTMPIIHPVEHAGGVDKVVEGLFVVSVVNVIVGVPVPAPTFVARPEIKR